MNISLVEYKNDFPNEVIQLVYDSMMNKFTSERSYDDLTLEEVRDEILKNNPVTAIVNENDVIVGICNPNEVEHKLYTRLKLDSSISYKRLGIIYIDEKYRNKGYASATLKEFLSQNINVVYITHGINEASNALAEKHMKLFASEFHYFKHYNIYINR